MSAKGPRKTSGTYSAGGALANPEIFAKSLRNQPSRDPAEDLESLEQGVALQTSTFRKAGWRWRAGRLLFEPADGTVSIGWQAGLYYSARRAAEPLDGTITVGAVEKITGFDMFWVKAHLFRQIRLTAAGQPWVIAVPTHDVPFVRAAVAAHNQG
jgi:hypothetical protein